MARELIAEIYPWESRVAVVEDGRLAEIFWADENESIGNIYKGRVKDILPGLSCAFIDIGLSKNAFMYAGDIVIPGEKKGANALGLLRTGQDILVQVKKEAFSEKGARVTGNVSIPGHLLVLLPYQNEVSISRKIIDDVRRDELRELLDHNRPVNIGIIVRTACLEAEDNEIIAEFGELLQVWEEIQKRFKAVKAPHLIYEDTDVLERTLRDYLDGDTTRVVINNLRLKDKIVNYMRGRNINYSFTVQYDEGDLFEKYNLEKDIKRSLRRKVWLKNGGYLIFDVAEAMTIIDVNSGKYTGTDNFEDTVYKLNMEAAVEIPRQLRLRSIGGIILIDFVDMKDKQNQERVIDTFKKEMEKDKAHTRIVGMTGLGFLEMTRKKSRYGVSEFFTDECKHCHGRGRTINLFALACEVKRKLSNLGYAENKYLVCEGHPEFLQYLQNDENNLNYIRKRTHKKIRLVADNDMPVGEYNIYTSD